MEALELLQEEKYAEARACLEVELSALFEDQTRGDDWWNEVEVHRANALTAAFGEGIVEGKSAREAWGSHLPHLRRLALSVDENYRQLAISVIINVLVWNFRVYDQERVFEDCVELLESTIGSNFCEELDIEDLNDKFIRLLNDPASDQRPLAVVLYANYLLLRSPSREFDQRLRFILQNRWEWSSEVFSLLDSEDNRSLIDSARLAIGIATADGTTSLSSAESSPLASVLKIQRGEALNVSKLRDNHAGRCLKGVSVVARGGTEETALAQDCFRRILSTPSQCFPGEFALVAAYCSATSLRKDVQKYFSALKFVETLWKDYFESGKVARSVVRPEDRFLEVILRPSGSMEAWSASFMYLRAHASFEAGDLADSLNCYEDLLEKRDFCGELLLPKHERNLALEFSCLLLLVGDLEKFSLVEQLLVDDRDVFSELFSALFHFLSTKDTHPLKRVGKRLCQSPEASTSPDLFASALIIVTNAIAAVEPKLTQHALKFLRVAMTLSEKNLAALKLVRRLWEGDAGFFVPEEDVVGKASVECSFCKLTRVPVIFLSAENREKLGQNCTFELMLRRVTHEVDFSTLL